MYVHPSGAVTEKLLSSESLFEHLMARPAFAASLRRRTAEFMRGAAGVLYGSADFARENGYWDGLEAHVSARVLAEVRALLVTWLTRDLHVTYM